MSRKRDTWRHQKNGTWTLSIGRRGDRVRLFQKRRDGQFYREVWVPGKGPSRKCLGTSDRGEAEQLARRLQAELALGLEQRKAGGKITLRLLWDRFRTECQAYLDNKGATHKDAKLRAKVLLAFFGDEVDVRSLTARDQAAFVAARRAGGLKLSDTEGDVTRPVGARTLEADLVLLHMMLNWATTVRVDGVRWLEFNPLQGIKRPREANPRRPVAVAGRN